MLLEITGLSNSGEGISRLEDGRLVFVQGALPDDVVTAELVSQKSDYAFARTLEVVTPSPERVESVCPFSSSCGGCSLICMSYQAQLAFKRKQFETQIHRVDPSVIIEDPVSGPPLHYRSRARFRYLLKDGKPSLSFYEQASNNNIPITSCAVADGFLNEFIANPPKLNVWELKDSQLSCITTDNGVLYDNSVGTITITAAQKTRTLYVSNSVFFQSNLVLLPKLIDKVASCVSGSEVMDLYSGVGTFSAFVEDKCHVTAVELNRNCLALAKRHLKNTSFFTAPVEKWKPSVSRVDTIIVDPPRTGLDKNVPALITSFNASTLIYVSCYLPTLARDLERLSQLGWKIENAQMFDFYPNTPHMECVVQLINQNAKAKHHVNIGVDAD